MSNLKFIQYKEEYEALHLSKSEKRHAFIFLAAVHQNETKTIDSYERFGDSFRKIILNRTEYDQQLFFGFQEVSFNEAGWLQKPKFIEQEEIEFPHRDKWAVHNYITIGRGINNIWTYGICYSAGSGGGISGISVFGKKFQTRKECMLAGLEELLKQHEKIQDKYSNRVIKQVKDLLDTLTGKKAIQLQIF